jgi:F0F1-type ATP synthase alpha subunit
MEAIRPFEEFLLPFVERRYRQIYDEIREKREISDGLRQTLDRAISEAKAEFVQTTGGKVG